MLTAGTTYMYSFSASVREDPGGPSEIDVMAERAPSRRRPRVDGVARRERWQSPAADSSADEAQEQQLYQIADEAPQLLHGVRFRSERLNMAHPDGAGLMADEGGGGSTRGRAAPSAAQRSAEGAVAEGDDDEEEDDDDQAAQLEEESHTDEEDEEWIGVEQDHAFGRAAARPPRPVDQPLLRAWADDSTTPRQLCDDAFSDLDSFAQEWEPNHLHLLEQCAPERLPTTTRRPTRPKERGLYDPDFFKFFGAQNPARTQGWCMAVAMNRYGLGRCDIGASFTFPGGQTRIVTEADVYSGILALHELLTLPGPPARRVPQLELLPNADDAAFAEHPPVFLSKVLRLMAHLGLRARTWDIGLKADPLECRTWLAGLAAAAHRHQDAALSRPRRESLQYYEPDEPTDVGPRRRRITEWYDSGRHGVGSTLKWRAPTGERLTRFREASPLRRVLSPQSNHYLNELTLLEAINDGVVHPTEHDGDYYLSHDIKWFTKYQGVHHFTEPKVVHSLPETADGVARAAAAIRTSVFPAMEKVLAAHQPDEDDGSAFFERNEYRVHSLPIVTLTSEAVARSMSIGEVSALYLRELSMFLSVYECSLFLMRPKGTIPLTREGLLGEPEHLLLALELELELAAGGRRGRTPLVLESPFKALTVHARLCAVRAACFSCGTLESAMIAAGRHCDDLRCQAAILMPSAGSLRRRAAAAAAAAAPAPDAPDVDGAAVPPAEDAGPRSGWVRSPRSAVEVWRLVAFSMPNKASLSGFLRSLQLPCLGRRRALEAALAAALEQCRDEMTRSVMVEVVGSLPQRMRSAASMAQRRAAEAAYADSVELALAASLSAAGIDPQTGRSTEQAAAVEGGGSVEHTMEAEDGGSVEQAMEAALRKAGLI